MSRNSLADIFVFGRLWLQGVSLELSCGILTYVADELTRKFCYFDTGPG